jgi:hypothetical protein
VFCLLCRALKRFNIDDEGPDEGRSLESMVVGCNLVYESQV